MAKTNKSKTSKNKKTSAKSKARAGGSQVRALVRSLDAPGTQYARLLMDPCNAPLVHPVYSGAGAGFLTRGDYIVTFGAGATEAAGFIHWTPGYVNSSNTHLIAGAGASGSTALTAVANGANSPLTSWLVANSFGCRCVAACAKIIYPGAEQTRSGRIHYGQTLGGLVDNNDSITVDNLAPTLTNFGRTPNEPIEILWKPEDADQEFNDPAAAASAPLKDRKSSVTIAWAGIPVSTGMTIQLTAVYEWTPKPGQGIGNNPTGKNTSANTLDHVVDAVQRTGFKWVRDSMAAFSRDMAGSILGAVAQQFGLMPARPYRPGLSF